MADIEECLKIILCDLLAAPVRAVLSDAISAVQITLNAQLAIIESKLLILNIPAFTAQALVNLAQDARAELIANLDILPTSELLDAIGECTDLGKLRDYLFLPLLELEADITEYTEEFIQMLSIVDDLGFLKREIDELLSFIQEVLLAISECGTA